jgi:hypothetical protein
MLALIGICPIFTVGKIHEISSFLAVQIYPKNT